MEEFHRIRRLPPYVFEQVNRAKAAARNAGADIIDLGMGNPDLPAPAACHREAEGDRSASRAPTAIRPRKGIAGLRRAQAAYYGAPLRREAQSRDPDRRDARLEGRLRQRGAGDHRAGRRRAGAQSELSDPRLRLPDGGRRDPLGAVGADAGILRGARARDRALDPEAARGRRLLSVQSDRLRRRASISTRTWSPSRRSTSIFVLSDLAYAEVYFDDNPPPSVLQVPGAMDVTVEFTSMSKTFSMPGWRMGFAVGNERIIAALARVKSYLDYGAFTPIQVAATAALNGPDDCIREMRDDLSKRRRDVLVESFGRAGWEIPPPRASMFAWAPMPEPFRDARQRRVLEAAGREGRASRSRPASASASTARAMSASRWSRTSSASARPRAISAASLKPAPKRCTTSFRSPSGARRAASHAGLRMSCMVAPAESGSCRPGHGRRRRSSG